MLLVADREINFCVPFPVQGFQTPEGNDIAFQKMFLARLEGGDYTFRISPTDNTAKNIFWKAIETI